MDVAFGISLAAEGGQYGTAKSDLAGLGFGPDKEQPNRLVRQVEGVALFADFLTEAPRATRRSRTVEDVMPSVVPGIKETLPSRRTVQMADRDVVGADQSYDLAVAGIAHCWC